MLTPRDGIRGKWLKLVLDGQSAKQHFALRANGLTRYSLGQSAIGDLPIPVPPLEVQDSIIERTFSSRRKIDESILGAEKLLHLLQDRKRSLIAAAVTGNIKAPGF
jgi:type I restriction enzyme S subunit